MGEGFSNDRDVIAIDVLGTPCKVRICLSLFALTNLVPQGAVSLRS